MNKKNLVIVAVVAIIGVCAGVYAVRRHRVRSGAEAAAAKYQCPMHPTYVSDHPGDCPICGMKLVAMEAQAPAAAAPVPGKVLYYRNPMRPDATSPVPMKDEMGMDYVPVYSEEKSQTPVAGQASTVVSAQMRRLIGMKSEPLRRRRLTFTVRASGLVAYDPDLYNAISEHHAAVMARDQVKDSPWPDVHERAEALVRAATLRLRQMGLSEEQIAGFENSAPTPTNLLVGGAGGSVWVYAQIYEYEIGRMRAGLPAEITTPAYPGRVFRGTVKAVDSNLSAETRSLKVRIEVPNPDGLLKLEMFVNAGIKADLGDKLALPEGALLDTGERKMAFVDLGEGRLEPREVKVGGEADGYYELLSGVKEGEKVVTTANFLIDSESRLKAAISGKR